MTKFGCNAKSYTGIISWEEIQIFAESFVKVKHPIQALPGLCEGNPPVTAECPLKVQ